jgi:hypothetical protein
MWTKPGGLIGMILITAFFVIGYLDHCILLALDLALS